MNINEFKNIKSIGITPTGDDTRTFKGLLASYGNVDRDSDVFVKGCFKEALIKREVYPLIYNHNTYNLENTIGYLKAYESERGVEIEAILLENDKNADKVYELLKHGALCEMSIGFGVEDFENDLTWDKQRQGFDFNKCYIREGSVVVTPANPQAVIEQVKSKKEELVENEEVVKKQEMLSDRKKRLRKIKLKEI
ncbi:MAG: HK97 family phage prohead protease [Oscillospiraceae bacterium]